MTAKIKSLAPWWIKIAVKIFLARLPIRYQLWRRIGIFGHGFMDRHDYAWRTIRSRIFDACGNLDCTGKLCLELGPGDSAFSALIFRALGAQEVILIDAEDFVQRDVEKYNEFAKWLSTNHVTDFQFPHFKSFDDVMRYCNARYITGGVAAFSKISDNRVDLVISQAVLEHIPLQECDALFSEFKRCASSICAFSHEIDLRDHLGDSLHNLRFSKRIWESSTFAASGLYTNRIRYSEFMAMFESLTPQTRVTDVTRWQKVPLDASKLHVDFHRYCEDDLKMRTFVVSGIHQSK